jgi:hypothetical protein
MHSPLELSEPSPEYRMVHDQARILLTITLNKGKNPKLKATLSNNLQSTTTITPSLRASVSGIPRVSTLATISSDPAADGRKL